MLSRRQLQDVPCGVLMCSIGGPLRSTAAAMLWLLTMVALARRRDPFWLPCVHIISAGVGKR